MNERNEDGVVSAENQTIHTQMLEHYQSGDLPWDDVLPPPEVIALTEQLTPARALDIGCGYGRTSIYLAKLGWDVDAVDFVSGAVEEARKRALAADVTVNIQQADVTQLDGLTPPYTLAIDIGCAHALSASGYAQHAAHLKRLLAPNAIYLLYARLHSAESTDDEQAQSGMDEAVMRTALAGAFTLDRVDYGEFAKGESRWPSAWFWWRRQQSA